MEVARVRYGSGAVRHGTLRAARSRSAAPARSRGAQAESDRLLTVDHFGNGSSHECSCLLRIPSPPHLALAPPSPTERNTASPLSPDSSSRGRSRSVATGRTLPPRPGSTQALERVSVGSGTRSDTSEPSAWRYGPGGAAAPVAIEVATRELRAASVNGPGSLAIDRAGGLRLDLAVEGSGRIAAPAVSADMLVIGLIGSGRIQLAGTAREVRASIHGWADLDAGALRTQGANIVTDSAGRGCRSPSDREADRHRVPHRR